MSNIRLFFSENISSNSNFKLDKSQSHYLSKVMRIKVGESFQYLTKMENRKLKFIKYPRALWNLV